MKAQCWLNYIREFVLEFFAFCVCKISMYQYSNKKDYKCVTAISKWGANIWAGFLSSNELTKGCPVRSAEENWQSLMFFARLANSPASS